MSTAERPSIHGIPLRVMHNDLHFINIVIKQQQSSHRRHGGKNGENGEQD